MQSRKFDWSKKFKNNRNQRARRIRRRADESVISELSKKLDKCEEEKAIFADCALSQKNIAGKMKTIRAKLKDADVLDQFDRVVFESLVEKVIVGEQA